MRQTLLKLQVAVLALGTAFAWITLVLDYRRFFAAGGQVLQLSGCAVANPIATPCFYGALAFLAAFAWSLAVLRSDPKTALHRERGLRWLLAAGTLFAWGNFGYEAYRFLQPDAGTSPYSCPPGAPATNPLLAPCFYGALLFLTALVISLLILRSRETPAVPGTAH